MPDLKAVVFVNGAEAVQPGGIDPASVAGGVEARDLPLLQGSAFNERIGEHLGRPLTRGDLAAITRLVQDVYRASKRPFVDVSVPAQNVQSGTVQIVVTQYRLGAVEVTGNRYFSSEVIEGMSDLQPGEMLTLPRMREALHQYNRNPFLTVNGLVRPGAAPGTTDLVLEASDRLPGRVYAGYDNQGVPTLGRDEWYMGVNFGNIFEAGHILSYQYTRSFEGRYASHSASYVAPVGPRDRVLLFGAYATQEPLLAAAFRSAGHSSQVSGRFSHELPKPGAERITLQLGFDYKRTDNNLDFLGFRILDTAVEVFQIPLVVTATIEDKAGQTVFENQLVISPGGFGEYNTDRDLQRLVPFAEASYAYQRTSLTRTTWLPSEFSWVVRAMGQVATGNLPYSEQLAGGGLGSVRGYDPNTVLGSEGVLLKTEVLAPPFSLLSGSGPFADGLQVGVFLDYANVWQKRRFPDSPRDADLASAGISVHYTMGRHLDVEVDLGQQLIAAPFRRDRETRLAVVATLSL